MHLLVILNCVGLVGLRSFGPFFRVFAFMDLESILLCLNVVLNQINLC